MKGYQCDYCKKFCASNECFQIEISINQFNSVYPSLVSVDLCNECYYDFIKSPYIVQHFDIND